MGQDRFDFAPAIPILKNILNPEFKTNKLRHNSLRAARNRSAFHAVSFPQPILAGNTAIDLVWLALGSAPMAEFAAHARPAAIVLDLQHGLWERGTVEAAIASTGQRVPVIARCADNTHAAIAQALDAGAASVLVPLIETVDDARRALDASRYPPRGSRSAGGVRPLLGGVAAMLEADTQVSVGLMIETVAGVENAQAIAALRDRLSVHRHWRSVPVARLLRSRRDRARLRAGLGRRPRARPALRHLHRQRRGARQAHGQGYRMAVAASDIDLLKQGLQSALAAAAPA